MRVVPVDEIKQLEADEIVMCVRGKVKRVWDRTEGTGAKGDWTVQNIVIEDKAGDEIKVAVWNHEKIPTKWKGEQIIIECVKTKKHGWSGIRTEDNKYNNKVTRQLKVSEIAELNLANERAEAHDDESGNGDDKPAKKTAAAADDEPQTGKKTDWRKTKVHLSGPLHDKLLSELDAGPYAWLTKTWLPRVLNTSDLTPEDTHLVIAVKAMMKAKAEGASNDLPTNAVDENKKPASGNGKPPPVDPGSAEAVHRVKLEIMRRANLYKMCAGAVVNLIQPKWQDITNDMMSPDQQQATIASMFIGAEKAGLHHMLPAVQIDDQKKANADTDKE